MRFSGEEERSVDFIEGELAFIQHLLEKGLPVMQPVLSKAGRFTERVETEVGAFHANLFEAISGEEPDAEEMSVEQLGAWGALMATTRRVLDTQEKNVRIGGV